MEMSIQVASVSLSLHVDDVDARFFYERYGAVSTMREPYDILCRCIARYPKTDESKEHRVTFREYSNHWHISDNHHFTLQFDQTSRQAAIAYQPPRQRKHRSIEPMGLRRGITALFASWLPRMRNGFLVHGAGINIGGIGILVAGRTGAGKSTIFRSMPPRYQLCDELVAITKTSNGVFALHSTPLGNPLDNCRKNATVPLRAIVHPSHRSYYQIRPLKRKEQVTSLLRSILVPQGDITGERFALNACVDIIESIPTYSLSITQKPASIQKLLCDISLEGHYR